MVKIINIPSRNAEVATEAVANGDDSSVGRVAAKGPNPDRSLRQAGIVGRKSAVAEGDCRGAPYDRRKVRSGWQIPLQR